MHPTVRILSARVHHPLIKFIGKRILPTKPESVHPHPAAPSELKKSFSDFVKKFESSSSSQLAGNNKREAISLTYNDFWEAPPRLWRRELEDTEIDAILSGGASLL